jgi:hypothetical protein
MKIYEEGQGQKFERPCFIVSQTLVTNEKRFGTRYARTYTMDIKWCPPLDSGSPISDCKAIGEQLLWVFRQVETQPLPTWTENVQYQIVDQELDFTFNALVHTRAPQDDIPLMNTLQDAVYDKNTKGQ